MFFVLHCLSCLCIPECYVYHCPNNNNIVLPEIWTINQWRTKVKLLTCFPMQTKDNSGETLLKPLFSSWTEGVVGAFVLGGGEVTCNLNLWKLVENCPPTKNSLTTLPDLIRDRFFQNNIHPTRKYKWSHSNNWFHIISILHSTAV